MSNGYNSFIKAPNSSQKPKSKFKKSNPSQTYGPIVTKKSSRGSKLYDSLTFVQNSIQSAATHSQQYGHSSNPKNYVNSGEANTFLEKEIRRVLNQS